MDIVYKTHAEIERDADAYAANQALIARRVLLNRLRGALMQPWLINRFEFTASELAIVSSEFPASIEGTILMSHGFDARIIDAVGVTLCGVPVVLV